MSQANIKDIDELIGPILGPHMQALLLTMREQYGYDAQPVPSVFALFVVQKCRAHGEPPKTDQCPELFAAEALKMLGEDVDDVFVQQASQEFQKTYHFHMQR